MNFLGLGLSPADFWLLSVAGVCIAWIVPHRLSIWRESNSRHIAAFITFRATIHAALEGLYPAPVKWPDNVTAIDVILRARFPAIQAAVANVRPFVPWYSRRHFDRAWLRYRSAYERDQDVQCYHHYANFDDNPNPKTVFKRNVDHLLSFAKET